jgi:hypothetical protein
VPGWLLAALVAGCLATAGWLFWADARIDDSSKEASTKTETRELAEGVLDVPDDETKTTDDRRADVGRDRLEAGAESGAGSGDDGDDTTTTEDPEPLPAVFEHLAGRTIALAPASANAGSDADTTVRIGGVRVKCGAAADDERLGAEVALLERVRGVLERAGAKVALVGGADAAAGCVDARVRELERADLGVVMRAGEDHARVLAARPAEGASTSATRAAGVLAAQLAGAIGLDAPTSNSGNATRDLLARTGAIDLDKGASVAYVEPVATSDEAADELALAIGRALALTLVELED